MDLMVLASFANEFRVSNRDCWKALSDEIPQNHFKVESSTFSEMMDAKVNLQQIHLSSLTDVLVLGT